MADAITSPKKLERISWQRGITDGNITKGFVADLTNVEIDRPGMLYSRDGLDPQYITQPTYSSAAVFRYNGDPSGIYNNGWLVYVTQTNVYIVPWGGTTSSTYATTALISGFFDTIDLETVDILIVGSNMYISSKDSDGSPNGLIGMSWAGETDRFSCPDYVEDTEDIYCQEAISGGWIVYEINRVPMLNVFATNSINELKIERAVNIANVTDWVADNNTFGVALYIELDGCFQIGSEPKYEDESLLEFVTVFEFVDGSLSSPSDVSQISLGEDGLTYDIGISLIASKEMSEQVKAIRIYRKIIAGLASGVTSDNYDLLFTANIYNRSDDKNTGLSSPATHGELTQILGIGSTARLSDHEEEYGVRKCDGANWVSAADSTDPSGQSNMFFDFHGVTGSDSAKITVGWIGMYAAQEFVMFMPHHYYHEGNVDVRAETWEGLTYFIAGYNLDDAVRITDRILTAATGSSGTYGGITYSFIDCIIKGSMPMPAVAATSGSSGIVTGGSQLTLSGYTITAITSIDNITDVFHGRGFVKYGTQSGAYGEIVSYTTTLHSDYYTGTLPDGFNASFAMFRDYGQVPELPTLEDEFGVNYTNSLVPKPEAIGASSGRLFLLNYTDQEGKTNPSGVIYSDPLKPSFFSASSFIEYGIRDDGIGVAVMSFKTYIVVLHTSACYIFDISGGAALTWREISSFSDIGCIDKKLTTDTPYGPLWCDRSHMYWLNSARPTPITDHIKETYSDFVDGADSLIYKEDLKQVWLTKEDTALVFDIPTQAFHWHILSEIAGDLISTIFTVGHSQYLVAATTGRTVNRFYKFDADHGVKFTWGLETGEQDFGVKEIIKKVKRVYLDFRRNATREIEPGEDFVEQLELSGTGGSGGNVYIKDYLVDDKVIRMSMSIRGYYNNIKAYVINEYNAEIGEEMFWAGKLMSFGVSYKSKNVK